MKKLKFFLLAVMAVMLVSCKGNEPELESKIHTGRIIGTLGCYDEATRTTFYKGYYIETITKDTVLSFNINVQDSIHVEYGSRVITPIQIPYSFTLTVLKSSDSRYIHYAPIIEDMYHPHITTANEIQVLINPLKK